jgi:hypothetical protein
VFLLAPVYRAVIPWIWSMRARECSTVMRSLRAARPAVWVLRAAKALEERFLWMERQGVPPRVAVGVDPSVGGDGMHPPRPGICPWRRKSDTPADLKV